MVFEAGGRADPIGAAALTPSAALSAVGAVLGCVVRLLAGMTRTGTSKTSPGQRIAAAEDYRQMKYLSVSSRVELKTFAFPANQPSLESRLTRVIDALST